MRRFRAGVVVIFLVVWTFGLAAPASASPVPSCDFPWQCAKEVICFTLGKVTGGNPCLE